MTHNERTRIQEANILKREKRKVAETRKQAEKIKAFVGGEGSMMQMLAGAIKKKLQLMMTRLHPMPILDR